MAYVGKFISNPKTGQSYRFIQTKNSTGGTLLEMESTYRAHSVEPPLHYHPFQTENFKVLKGRLQVKMNGVVSTINKGDELHIPAGTSHAMWNDSNEDALLSWQLSPALESEYFFEIFTGLAKDNKTNDRGLPPFLQTILLIKRFSNEFRPSKPSHGTISMLHTLLKPLANLRGYKNFYREYID